MTNLFSFEYQETPLFNLDGSKSNFRQVYGFEGKNVVCPKGTYHIVKTTDLSVLGQSFLDKGYTVKTFNHRNGEVIGLNVSFGDKPTKVGACTYNLIITVPNNGGGKGFLSIKQTRLICLNGMVSSKTMHKDNYIKIPHTIDYKNSIELMKQSIESFTSLMEQVENRDNFLNAKPLTDIEVLFNLNKWFFENEMPISHKKEMTFDDFRKLLAIAPDEIKSIERYNELKTAYTKELGYNAELDLKLSMYTVYATVTNYLSRRIEKSNSSASNETQFERSSKKITYFDNVVKE
tara:strand:+ start:75 stop:947 length:873 start_codon:yes stop_codon:yes gene_type:complete